MKALIAFVLLLVFVGFLAYSVVNAVETPLQGNLLFSDQVESATSQVTTSLMFFGFIAFLGFMALLAVLIWRRN